jgi:hypothetical protein
MRKAVLAGMLLAVFLVLQGPAFGQSDTLAAATAPDKSNYTLFNPTPDDQLRSFCTDRPTKSNFPCTVDAGRFQYEADAINWTYSRSGGVRSNEYLLPNPTFKLGLTNTVDFEVNIAPVDRLAIRGGGANRNLVGVSDLILRSKFNVVGPEGGDFQATLLPFVKVPTAKPGIGNKAVEGGLIVPVLFALPHDITLVFDPEVDVLRNAQNTGRHVNFQTLANFSRPLSETVFVYAELWGAYEDEPSGAIRQASVDLALSYAPWSDLPNLQFDIGANIGLTNQTPKLQAYLGVSQRF